MDRFFRSIVEQDLSPVVICDLQHVILYMNPAAKEKYGAQLLGKSVMDCHSPAGRKRIEQVVGWFAADISHNRVHTIFSEKESLDVYMVALRNEEGGLIGYYEKLESRMRDSAPLYEL